MNGCAHAVISRHLGSDERLASFEDALANRLQAEGVRVVTAPHLYHLPHGSELWDELAALPEPLAIAGWLHPRPLDCLFIEYAGREPAATLDLGAFATPADASAAIIEAVRSTEQRDNELRRLEAAVSERWYPVIDRSRCTGCRHCLQFCLFGVYESEASGRVSAAQPDNCKPGCPACSRICPHGAIIFPLCDDPAIAGAPGSLMEPDPAARRMFYVRTGRECPACGRRAVAAQLAASTGAAASCEECGSPLDVAQEPAEPSPVHQEIDDLIDELDRLAGDSRGEAR